MILTAINTLPSTIFIDFNNLTINGGTTTLGAALTITNNLNITSGTFNTSASGNYGLTLYGNYTNNGTFTGNGSAITFTGAGTQSIAGFTTTGTVSMTKAGGTATFTGNVNGGALTINGSGGTLNLGTGLTHTFTGTWTRTAGTLDGGSSTLNLSGALSGTAGTFTADAGTVNYNASGAQTAAAVTYSNLVFSGSGVKSMTNATLSVSGNLSIAPTGTATNSVGTGLNISVGSLTLGGLGTINGTWGSASSSATYKSSTYFAATTGYLTVSRDTRTAPLISTSPTATAITYGQALSASTLSGGAATNAAGTSVSGSFAFTTPSTVAKRRHLQRLCDLHLLEQYQLYHGHRHRERDGE